MPSYVFVCERCENTLDLFQSFSEPLPTKCPSCGASSDAFHQDYSQSSAIGLCKGWDKITTFGQAAEYNERRMGKEQMQKMAEGEKAKRRPWTGPNKGRPIEAPPDTPWLKDDGKKPLDLSKIKNVQRYIETGDTNA